MSEQQIRMNLIKGIKLLEQRNKIRFVYPDGEELNGEIIEEIEMDSRVIDENTTGKVYKNLVQKIMWDREFDREYFRFCYYYINFDNEKPRWIFGQYALTLSKKQFKELVNKMKEKGWI